MLDDTPRNFAENRYSLGVGVYAITKTSDDDPDCDACVNLEYTKLAIADMQDIFVLTVGQENILGGKKTFLDASPGSCINDDPQLEFFVEKAVCYSDLAIFGNPELAKGQYVELDVELDEGFRDCVKDTSQCTESQRNSYDKVYQYEEIKVIIFTQEAYLDYLDYDNSMPTRTKMVTQIKLIKNRGGEMELPSDVVQIQMKSQLNKAILQDSPLVNPWGSSKGDNQGYLSTESINILTETAESDKPEVASLQVSLSDNQILRSRSVYNIIDMVADVSGMVDVLLVFSGFLMSTLFTKQLLKASLVSYISLVQLEGDSSPE